MIKTNSAFLKTGKHHTITFGFIGSVVRGNAPMAGCQTRGPCTLGPVWVVVSVAGDMTSDKIELSRETDMARCNCLEREKNERVRPGTPGCDQKLSMSVLK